MSNVAATILALGFIFLAGLAADLLGRRTGIPRVTLLLLFGIATGPAGFDLLPAVGADTVELVTIVTLSFVAFLMGGSFRLDTLRTVGKDVLVLSFLIAAATALVVTAGIFVLTGSLVLSLTFGAIAIATDPIAIHDVIGRDESAASFAERLRGIVLIDDAWALFAFSLVLVAAELGNGGSVAAVQLHLLREIGGALALGAILGLPMALLTGRIEPGEPTLVEAAGFVLLCAGLAVYFEVSMLLASMTMGMVTTNLARHHNRPFRAVSGIEWPLLVAFFILTGAALRIDGAAAIAGLTAAYCLLRVIGRLLGGALGARARRRPRSEQQWYGLALLPQAGVALGVALVASHRFPDLGETLLPAMVLATIVFEFLGPALTRLGVTKNRTVG